MKTPAAWGLLKEAFSEWDEHKAPRLGAALSFYTVLSLAPLLVICLAVAGLAFGNEAAEGRVAAELSAAFGPAVGESIGKMIPKDEPRHAGVLTMLLGAATLLFGAAGVFGQLQDALNTIWEVQPKPGRGVWGFVRDRFLSFTMVLGVCFLLLVSLVLSAGLSALAAHWTPASVPGGAALWEAANNVVSLAVVTLLFAAMFKVLPDVRIQWRDVWVGAFVTAALFTLGKLLLGLYLGRSGVASSYGAAGSVVLVLLWVYYSAQIFLFGAAFTRAYAHGHGSNPQPTKHAASVSEPQQAKEGAPKLSAQPA